MTITFINFIFLCLNIPFYFSEKVFVRNPSVSLSPTLTRNEKVEHHVRIKVHKPIALRIWVDSGVSVLYG